MGITSLKMEVSREKAGSLCCVMPASLQKRLFGKARTAFGKAAAGGVKGTEAPD